MAISGFSSGLNLVDMAIADMHRESNDWLSQVEFWNIEINFFQNLLDKDSLFKLVFGDNQEAVRPIKQLVDFHKAGYLGELEEIIRNHENYLAQYIRKEPEHTGKEYVSAHIKLRQQMRDFEEQFRNYKQGILEHAELVVDMKQLLGTSVYNEKIENLHHETQDWLSSLNFWKVEMGFFQKLLERKNTLSLDEGDHKKVSHLQNIIIYYNGEVIDNLMHDVKQHEKLMGKIVKGEVKEKEDAYLEAHMKLRDALLSFQKSVREFKSELYSFAEGLDEKIKNLF